MRKSAAHERPAGSGLPPRHGIDYFKDDLVVRLLDYIHGKLAPGGAVLLGNFRPDHPNAALFRHALDWPLALRSEDELLRLVAQSRFANSPVRVGTEAEGVQLFVTCVKPDGRRSCEAREPLIAA